jgi:hypothetical protein
MQSSEISAIRVLNYPAIFLACALNFAHRFLAALAIFALAAADKTRLHASRFSARRISQSFRSSPHSVQLLV